MKMGPGSLNCPKLKNYTFGSSLKVTGNGLYREGYTFITQRTDEQHLYETTCTP